MSNTATARAGRNAPLFAWLGPLARLAELGTEGYPRPARRQMAIVNLMAVLIAVFSAVYAIVFAFYGMDVYLHLIVVNLLLVAVALLVPLAHRISDIAGALLIAIAEFAALFYFVRALGHDSGIQTNYIIAAAVAFAICGMTRFRLTVAVIVTGLALHLAAWFLFPPERALIAAPPALLANLYVSSAVTTFGMIALIVGYAFTLADHARAEADALLANILPEAIAERLKERPGERVADSVAEASVLFSDLVGFTELAKRLGAARTVALLDQVVTEFDRLAAAHGVEKIKTTGDGYMAVAGVSRPQADHLPRLARMALCLPDLVEQLSATHGVDLRIRIGIASGPVMAGVIGADKFSYDVWGETVNLASRLEFARAAGRDPGMRRLHEDASSEFRARTARGNPSERRRRSRDLAAQEGACAWRERRGPYRMTWRATILTIFPEMFPGPLGLSLAGKALAEGKWALGDHRHPRLRHRQAPLGRRHACRRRRRHGDARRYRRCVHRCRARRDAGSHAYALSLAARQAAHASPRPGACGRSRRDPALRALRGRR